MTMIYAQCEFMNLIKRAFTGTHLSPNYQVNPHPINLSEHPISKVCDIAMNGGGRARDAYGISLQTVMQQALPQQAFYHPGEVCGHCIIHDFKKCI